MIPILRSSVLAFMIVTAPSHAHHSAALFDTTSEVTFEGTVTRFDWKNPHVYMAIEVRGVDGRVTEQPIEVGASSVLQPLGLARDAVSIGEHVTIRANPSKQGAGRIVLGLELVKADGTILPLNINSTSRRAAPKNMTATSIEGTWFSPLRGFRAYRAGLPTWQLTEKGRLAVAEFESTATPHADCVPVTAPTLMIYPVATSVEVDADIITFRVDWMASERVVYLDGRAHPEGGQRSLHGHSIGHWEGDTLVVDTVQFSDHREGIAMGGLPSGAGKHLVERFSLTEDRRHLRYSVTLTDPEYVAAPITYSSELDYRPDLEPSGLPCDLGVARRFLSNE